MGGGLGGVPIPTRGIHCGTLYMYVLCDTDVLTCCSYCCSYRTTVTVLACCSCIAVHRELELLFLLVAPVLLFIQMFLLVAPVLLIIQNYGCCSCFCSCYIAVPFYAVIPAHLSSPYSWSKLIKTCCCAKY